MREERAARRSFRVLNALRRVIEVSLMSLGGACVLLIMLLTAADVFARYVLASPIRGAYEFVQTLLAVGMFASLPLVGLRGEHISVRLIESERLGTLGRWVDLALLAISAIVFVFLAHRLWLLADLVGSNEQTLGAMAIPLDPLYRSMSVLAGLAALVIALMVAPARFMRGSDAEGENSP